MNFRKEEDLVKRQSIEKRALPKRIRNEMKAREMMFRESVRINMSHSDPEDERERLKKVVKLFKLLTVFIYLNLILFDSCQYYLTILVPRK